MHGKGRVASLAVSLLALSVSLATPAGATDRYWVNMFGGDWVETAPWPAGENWRDPAGQPGVPQAGDNALVVFPYPLSTPGYTQPVWANYANVPNGEPPTLGHVVVEADNILYQMNLSYFPAKYASYGGYNLDLHSSSEIVGGSGWTFTYPPGVFNPNPAGLPPKGKHVQGAGTNTVDSQLILGGTAGSQGVYQLTGGSLAVGDEERIGQDGTGTFTQSGGSHTVGTPGDHGTLYLAYGTNGTGTYVQTGGNLTVEGTEHVGYWGAGTFQQTGGEHWAGTLKIGSGDQDGTGTGSYQMTGTFSRLTTGSTIVGASGLGTFTQTKGAHDTDRLILGSQGLGNGGYELSGSGTVSVGSEAVIGGAGRIGLFNQNGGHVEVDWDGASSRGMLAIGQESQGFYNLDAGELWVRGTETVGAGAYGALLQTGGHHWVKGQITLGGQRAGEGHYILSGEGELLVEGNVTVGESGTGTLFQRGGTMSVSSVLAVGQEAGALGTDWQSGGTLETGMEYLGGLGAGRLLLEAGATRRIGSEASPGSLVVGGVLNPDGTLTAGQGGVVRMTGGTLDVSSGEVLLNTTHGAFEDPMDFEAAFVQTGGTHTVAGTLRLQPQNGGKAAYVLDQVGFLPPSLTTGATEIKRGGEFTQAGGVHTTGGLLVEEGGTYHLKGGELDSGALPDIHGEFLQTGGHHAAGNLYVFGTGRYELGAGLTLDADAATNSGEFDMVADGMSTTTLSARDGLSNLGRFHVVATEAGEAHILAPDSRNILNDGEFWLEGNGDIYFYGDITNYGDIHTHKSPDLPNDSAGPVVEIDGDLNNRSGGIFSIWDTELLVQHDMNVENIAGIRDSIVTILETLHIQGNLHVDDSDLHYLRLWLDGGMLWLDPSTAEGANVTVSTDFRSGWLSNTRG